MHKSLDEFEIRFHGNRQCYNLKNGFATYSRLFLMGSFSYLHVMMTYIRAWMSLKFGQIQPRTTELAALKRLKLMFPFFLALYNGSQVSIVAYWATCYVLLENLKCLDLTRGSTTNEREMH